MPVQQRTLRLGGVVELPAGACRSRAIVARRLRVRLAAIPTSTLRSSVTATAGATAIGSSYPGEPRHARSGAERVEGIGGGDFRAHEQLEGFTVDVVVRFRDAHGGFAHFLAYRRRPISHPRAPRAAPTHTPALLAGQAGIWASPLEPSRRVSHGEGAGRAHP